jgi:TonB family protein
VVTNAPVRLPAPAPAFAPSGARSVHRAGKPPRKNKLAIPIAIGCAVLLAAAVVTPRLFRRPATEPDAPEVTQVPAPGTSAATATSEQKWVPQQSLDSSAKEEPQREPLPATAPSTVPALAHPEAVNEEATNTVARSAVDASTRGQVTHRAMPEVLQSAVRSIHGTVRVNVKVNVDRAGNVEDAELAARGPSRYFAHAAVEAARQWKFDPPKVGGRGVLSSWILQFEFTRDGTNIVPRQELP